MTRAISEMSLQLLLIRSLSTRTLFKHVQTPREVLPFAKVVANIGSKPADVIIEHGREMGHTLTIVEETSE